MSDHSQELTTPLSTMTNAWAQMTGSFFKSAAAANTAALTAFDADRKVDADETNRRPASVSSVEYDEADWESERSVENAADITVGDTVRFSKEVDDDDVHDFARASGDTNRLHLDEEFAETTRFGGRIAHGTLVSGLISAALARLPGLTIYLSQDLEFTGPVNIGDRITATVEIIEDLGDNQFRLSTIITDENQEKNVIEGEAVVLIDDLPEDR
ncbi:MaoC family dehydratase [Halostella pelagica]|uniref:MaoC family dehydratase n=1 Tax=Halostella pelagica TaxID=2583824 RepID=UPI001F1A629A|nr:MaoC family dehydratase [Halostella pelagica]